MEEETKTTYLEFEIMDNGLREIKKSVEFLLITSNFNWEHPFLIDSF